MVKIVAVDRDGQDHEIEADTKHALMFVLRDDAGLPVEGECGGVASCATCHVFIDKAWVDRLPTPESFETQLLESLDHFNEEQSRLACQVNLTAEQEGLRLTLAPEE